MENYQKKAEALTETFLQDLNENKRAMVTGYITGMYVSQNSGYAPEDMTELVRIVDLPVPEEQKLRMVAIKSFAMGLRARDSADKSKEKIWMLL